MVKKGAFVVQLVDAESKLPFSEVATSENGSLQTHIPLHRDYFIRVESNLDERVLVNFRVNGKSLGYEVKLGSKASYCGLYSHNKEEGESLDRALRVEESSSSSNPADPTTAVASATGIIQATFYEAIYDDCQRRRSNDSASKRASRTVLKRGAQDTITKKSSIVVKDAAVGGDHVEPRKKHKDSSKGKYRKGAVLSRVEVKYSDTLEITDQSEKPLDRWFREQRAQSVPKARATTTAPCSTLHNKSTDLRSATLYRSQTAYISHAA